jgi:hypothetical protein
MILVETVGIHTLFAGNTNSASRRIWQQQSLCRRQLSSFFIKYNYVETVIETHILYLFITGYCDLAANTRSEAPSTFRFSWCVL